VAESVQVADQVAVETGQYGGAALAVDRADHTLAGGSDAFVPPVGGQLGQQEQLPVGGGVLVGVIAPLPFPATVSGVMGEDFDRRPALHDRPAHLDHFRVFLRPTE